MQDSAVNDLVVDFSENLYRLFPIGISKQSIYMQVWAAIMDITAGCEFAADCSHVWIKVLGTPNDGWRCRLCGVAHD